MSYKINFTDTLANPQGITVQDQSLNNADTDLVFVGKNFPGYSQFIGENFLHLLENFAKNIPPVNPIKGQLWYDTGTSTSILGPIPQLKIYDGTNWTESSSIKKSVIRPAAENSIVGDLWVDATNQQLYLYTGSTWILVGPQFNESSTTGFRAEGIIDSATNTEKIVISFFIEEKRVLIISRYEFVPKIRIEGYTVIRQGLNLSNEDFDLDGVMNNKFWGTSEKSNALVIGNATIAAANFLRGDTASTTGFQFNIRSSSGLSIGPGLETSITSSSAGTVIHQTNPGSNIILRTTQTQGTFNNSVTVTADGKVGVNKIPTESLDVVGNFLLSGTANINNETESSNRLNGAFVVAGGAGVGKNLNVGGDFSVQGISTFNEVILPNVTNTFDIGSSSKRFQTVHTQNVVADVVGNSNDTTAFRGNVTGSSATAARLTTSYNFNLVGDVVSNSIPFNGTAGVTLSTTIGDGIITSRPETVDSQPTDQFLIYRATATPSLRKINKSTLFANVGTVPAGSVFPFAGDTLPPGYLLCDGSEQSRNFYTELFTVLGFKYKPESQLVGFQTFALPDFRGRFAAGRENMDNGNPINKQISATGVTRNANFAGAISVTFLVPNATTTGGPFQVGRAITGTGLLVNLGPAIVSNVQNNTPVSGVTTVTVSCQPQLASIEATNLSLISIGVVDAGGGTPVPSRIPGASALGNVGGSSSVSLNVNQLPQHNHTLKDSVGNQYYAVNSTTGPTPEPNVINGDIRFTSGEGHLLNNSGNIDVTGSLGNPIDTINPYLTVNYIIFTGRI